MVAVGDAFCASSKKLVGAFFASIASPASTGTAAADPPWRRSKFTGDSYLSPECRRCVLYQPSMNSNTAARASAGVRNVDRSRSSHSSVAKKLSHSALS